MNGGCIMKRVLVALLAISMAAGVLTGCGSKGSDKTFTVGKCLIRAITTPRWKGGITNDKKYFS